MTQQMDFERLWAKRWRGRGPAPESTYLPGHLMDVHTAAQSVIEATTESQFHAIGLPVDLWFDRFHRVVCLAAALHDLGKANDHFQGMIKKDRLRRDKRQGLRHEWVTWLLLQREDFRNWLLPAFAQDHTEVDWHVVQWAVAGHHPAFHRPSPPGEAPDGAGDQLTMMMDHKDFKCCLDWITTTFSLDTAAHPKCMDAPVPLAAAKKVFVELKRAASQHAVLWEKWTRGSTQSELDRFVAIVKDTLVAADVAGSALPCEVAPEGRPVWIGEAFRRRPQPADLQEIITARLTDSERGVVSQLRPFQEDVAAKAGDVTFVRAGCGTGKTVAAYHWAKERHPGKRLCFCYPTTGTATEGFRDHLYEPDERVVRHDAGLFHGRAAVDLEMVIAVQAAEETQLLEENKTDEARNPQDEADDLERIESLDAWSTPIVNCTVDTVLGVMQNNRRGLYAWPALAGAAFVFDEIHSYDDRLFGSLLRFIQSLPGLPVLLMTASLPDWQLTLLGDCTKRRGSELVCVDGPTDLEELPRYHWNGVISRDDPLPQVRDELARGDKVLWVCNTVNRAINAWERASDSHLAPLIYHSRFRYEDRVDRHTTMIEAFKNCEATLAICTQVAEQSLDLKGVTLLVTDLAPVPSVIQRLGRLNRQAEDGDPTRPFTVIEPLDDQGNLAPEPYNETELGLARSWLDRLPVADIQQQHLSRTWEEMNVERPSRPPTRAGAWLDGGPFTEMKELREGSYGITVILRSDAEAHRAAPRDQRPPLARLLLPMPTPKSLPWRDWPKYRGVPQAPDECIDYNSQRGAKWNEGGRA